MSKRRRSYHRKKLNAFKLKKGTTYTIVSVVLFSIAGVLLVSLLQPDSPVLSIVASNMTTWFGRLAIVIPIILISLGLLFFRLKMFFAQPHVTLGLFLVFLSVLGMGQSGQMGEELWKNLSFFISEAGAWVLFLGTLIIGFAIFLNTSLDEIFYFLVSLTQDVGGMFAKTFQRKMKPTDGFSNKEMQVKGGSVPSPVQNDMKVTQTSAASVSQNESSKELSGLQSTIINKPGEEYTWEYPPLSLLSESKSTEADAGDVKKNASTIEQTLDSFGIRARVLEVNLGPAVTQYALEIALGTKLSKITSLANDLALALAAPTGQIRIEAPIPGRSLVGVEVPNRSLRVVTLREMLMTETMRQQESKLAVAIGLDVAGQPIIVDLATMPHMLVAGTTGSGKSVMMNSIIASLLFRTTPAEVRMILIDPKRVEMTTYNDIPHLLTPVIVEPDQTLSALKWAMAEMDRRYKMFAQAGARNILSYNQAKGYQEIPYIVIIIDELADLMIFAAAEVEDAITRLAQMARATGIHLVVSTQRPSVNVITGLIKANIPARVSFNVSSMIDSRVILDMPGAEKLLGRGDMLFIPPTQSKPLRVQGTFVSEKEVKQLVDFLKKKVKSQGIPVEYTEEVVQQQVTIKQASGLVETTEGKDPKFIEAQQIVIQYDRASASLLQRRLKVGYARAARILDQLEEAGIVGQAEGSKPREVLIRGGDVSPQ
ncbi:MAG: DNA translocase FtsK [Candidatus Roizmanbacteria bacterium]|nr:DNA translocase FtsK [Candidatus Roizmanbacteria bacterium]